ncbi:MAG TPA: hypothetical protein VK857_05940 [Desulforhopalus sp.]|nr:hypothetical protein [Desulforhopalus sp.]
MPDSTLPDHIYRTIVLCILLFLGYGTAAMAEEGEIAFTLLYSNNVSGEVAPCGG